MFMFNSLSSYSWSQVNLHESDKFSDETGSDLLQLKFSIWLTQQVSGDFIHLVHKNVQNSNSFPPLIKETHT